jgi:hypothetical protein
MDTMPIAFTLYKLPWYIQIPFMVIGLYVVYLVAVKLVQR